MPLDLDGEVKLLSYLCECSQSRSSERVCGRVGAAVVVHVARRSHHIEDSAKEGHKSYPHTHTHMHTYNARTYTDTEAQKHTV